MAPTFAHGKICYIEMPATDISRSAEFYQQLVERGVDRARAVFDWEATQGTALIRIGAVLAVLMGGFIAYAVAVDRRPA